MTRSVIISIILAAESSLEKEKDEIYNVPIREINEADKKFIYFKMMAKATRHEFYLAGWNDVACKCAKLCLRS